MNLISDDARLSNFPESYWLSHPMPHFPKMTTNSKTEIAVVGGHYWYSYCLSANQSG